ncbi:hypothetical protein QFC21_005223 [Naganishia friedmannii]|uniref:Uncharacterized protein n=1 Tax=Naganishia friedmannii TaxID=89922 RepID=A0ACC2VCR1_9TREE|nr:hypothetical protein QFC21_005223 [Naganishia friedmannii]
MVSKLSLSALALAVFPVAIRAHIALWDEAMFGWEDDPNQSNVVTPLANMAFNDWWLHGPDARNKPPKDGSFMELPSGGVYHGYTSCNKQQSKFGNIDKEKHATIYACKSSTDNPADGIGAMHTSDHWGDPKPKDVKGTSIAIAYESDINKLTPEMFSVISVNYTSVWFQQTDYHIPGDLPACPAGGCICMWSWIHAPDAGSEQIYQNGYRCKTTGASGSRSLPAPQIANKCHYPTDTTNCTVGPKQPHYWLQNERNNNHQGIYDPPYYNGDYGFMDGAQTDLFANVAAIESVQQTSTVAPSSSSSTRHLEQALPTTSASSDAAAAASSTGTLQIKLPVASAVTSSSNPVTTPRTTPVYSTSSTSSMVMPSDPPAATTSVPTPHISASSTTSRGRTCRHRRKRGTLRRRRVRRSSSNNQTVENEKRAIGGRLAIPDLRIGVVASHSVQFDSVNARPSREFRPEGRRAVEAAGSRGMSQSEVTRSNQRRSRRSTS